MRLDRLMKLAEHLESGTLGHDNFDFSAWNRGNRKENNCGTNGCALGECPILFPKEWFFIHDFDSNTFDGVGLWFAQNSKGFLDAFTAAEEFFALNAIESDLLFCPGENSRYQNFDHQFEGETKVWIMPRFIVRDRYQRYVDEMKSLPSEATRYEVAEQIKKFISFKIEGYHFEPAKPF